MVYCIPHKSVQCTLQGNVMCTRKQARASLSAQLGMQQPWEERMRNILIMILPYLFYHHPAPHPPGHRNFSSNRYSRSPLSTLLPNAAVCSCCFLISSDAVVVPFELRCKSSNKLASIVVFLLLASRLLPSSVRYPHLHFILVLLKL